jgi:hypothetical protein
MMARFKRVDWILLAFLALGPTSVFAQQEKPPQKAAEPKTEEPQQRATEAVQAKTEEAPGQTEGAQAPAEKERGISGMSVLGNQDAPKSLVIVPWKSSEIGKSLGISTMLDDSRQPIDKDVFMRGLSYYEIRSQTSRTDSAPAGNNVAPATTGAQRRK